MNDTLTPKEAGSYLKLHLRTIYRLAKQGKIPGRERSADAGNLKKTHWTNGFPVEKLPS